MWDDFLRWYEECFEFLVTQKEELSEILDVETNESLNVFLKNDFFTLKKIFVPFFKKNGSNYRNFTNSIR